MQITVFVVVFFHFLFLLFFGSFFVSVHLAGFCFGPGLYWKEEEEEEEEEVEEELALQRCTWAGSGEDERWARHRTPAGSRPSSRL